MSVPTFPRLRLAGVVFAGLLMSTTHSLAQTLVRPAQVTPGAQGLHRAGAMVKADTALNRLVAEYDSHAASSGASPFRPSDSFLQFDRGRVVVQAVASGSAGRLERDLESLGLQDVSSYGNMVAGRLAVGDIRRAVKLDSLQFLAAAYPPVLNTGIVTSQGDVALRADVARDPGSYGVDGSGVTVGVLSDSYDVSTMTSIRASDDVASGDLPAGNLVQGSEYAGCGVLLYCLDEGRAMMQIVHDLAPGANLLFHTALDSGVAFANAIDDLANAGAGVIVDDIVYLDEPMFQDGVVAQAVDSAVAGGAAYFSAAGNSARRSWEAPFRDSGEDLCIDFIPDGFCDPIYELVGRMEDFDPGPGVDVYQSITIPVGGTLAVALQWDAPFGNVNTGDGPDNDHILVLLDSTGGVMLDISANDNVSTGSPYEIIQYQNLDGTYGGPTGTQFNLVITYDYVDSPGPPATLLKTILYGSGTAFNEYQTNSPTLVGHANAAGAIAVGASYWQNTPAFGVSPPLREPYSSAGGSPVLFDTSGNPLSAPVVRAKPEITATDGVSTTFFYSPDSDGDGFRDFFGTSAAAPHAAAIGALMREFMPAATAAQIRDAMQASAIDMDAPGFDNDSGAGLVQADAAIAALAGSPPANSPPTADFTFAINNLDVDFTDASTDSDGTVSSWDWNFGDGNTDTVQNPSHSYATAGTYSVTLTVHDNDGDSDSISKDVTVSEPATFVDQLATGQSLTWGSESGGFAATQADDGVVQAVTEESTKGNPASRVSRMRMDWTFNVTPGSAVTLYANSWVSASTDGDQVQYSYSTDGTSYTILFTESRTTDEGTYLSAALPSTTSGMVYVRAEDTDRTPGNTSLDTLYVDHLYIHTDLDGSSPPPPGPAAMHVADLDGAATLSGNGKRWNADVTIFVVDSDGAPVANAGVSGDWSTNGGSSCTTDGSGTCTVSKGSNTSTASVAFTVTGVSNATLPYDPSANSDPDGDSDGTTISVAMP